MFNESGGNFEEHVGGEKEIAQEAKKIFNELGIESKDLDLKGRREDLVETLRNNAPIIADDNIAKYRASLESSVERSADQSQEMINQIRLDLEIARILFESGYPDKAFEMIDNEEDGILAYAENIADRDEVCAEFAQKVVKLADLLYQLSEENDH